MAASMRKTVRTAYSGKRKGSSEIALRLETGAKTSLIP